MAEAETVAPEGAPEEKKRLPVKLIGIAVVVLGLLGGAYVMFLAPGGEEEGLEGDAAVEEPLFSSEEGEILPVADATWSLAGPDPHFARLSFSAVLSVDALPADVEPRLPLLRDAAVTVLAGTSAEVMRTPAGLDQLRLDLMAEADKVWPDGEIVRILLGEVVVQ